MILEITLVEPKLACSQEFEGPAFTPAHVVTKQIPIKLHHQFSLAYVRLQAVGM